MNRRSFIQKSAMMSCMVWSGYSLPKLSPMILRKIPSTGEQIPIVGVGTWLTFDAGNDKAARENLKQVLKTFNDLGGKVIDSSPMYGSSEKVVGDLVSSLGIRNELFLATKVWTSGKNDGIIQMNRSFDLMKTKTIDLMQVHNLLDAESHLATLQQWKADGRIRYIGLTHYHDGGYQRMISLMKKYPVDFIQIDYSINNLNAAKVVLPTAQKRNIAVLINRPYAGGQLFNKVRNKPLPAWSREFDCNSWGQYFLKYILSNPSVTCVIPGTSKVHHLRDNLQAGVGKLPNPSQRNQMIRYLSSM